MTLLALLAVSAAHGQPIPKLNSISPEWIQRGTTVDVVLTGENLGSATGFIFSGEAGLSATNIPAATSPSPTVTIESGSGAITRAEMPRAVDQKRVVARVTASANAALNPRELRVVTPAGVSNPLLLNVGHLPELPETSILPLPAAVSGVIGAAAEVDQFKFKASKGQELVFEVDAARRGSPLDASLSVADTKGKELARNEDYNGLDSLLTFKAPEDDEYILQIRDFRYMGGGNFNYRLYGGALPYVENIFPFGGQRGKQTEIALNGKNLEGTAKMTLNIAPNSPLGRQDI
ncbi:MAG TPA: PPC domain-containing protein, partial [Verrucomicrobiae bacterium]|nr:PPC domain-containing protein [Verrucomicrobiae bacterium]